MPAIPEGFSTITPSLVLSDAAKAIELYKKALGAKEISCSREPNSGKIMHACLQIGNSMLFLCDEMPGSSCMKASTSSFYLYMPSADEAFSKATSAGMKEAWPVQDMFWGDRTGTVTDEFGINWTLATHQRDVTPEDIQQGMKDMAAKMKDKPKAA